MSATGTTRGAGPPARAALRQDPARVALVLGLLYGLAATGSSAVAVTLPELAADLDLSTGSAVWVISAYALALAVATAVHGRLADRVGIRAALAAGVVMMAGGALLASLAPTVGPLLVGRVVQGAGGAAVAVLGSALLVARWPGPASDAALGRLAGTAAALSSSGPLIGGGLEGLAGWRASTAIPVLGLGALPLIWRAGPSRGTPGRIDIPGAILVAGAAAGLVLVIQSPAVGVGAALVGLVLLSLAVPAALRVRARPEGFLPRVVVTDRSLLRSALAGAATPAAWFALLVAVPVVLAEQGWSPPQIGLLAMPAAALALVIPRVSRWLLARLGAAVAMLAACLIAALALLISAGGAAAGRPSLLAVGLALVVASFTIGQPSMVAGVRAAVPESRRGVALGVATLIFLSGGAVGSAAIGGLAEPIGVAGALLALLLLPICGAALMADQIRRARPARGP